MDQRVAHILNDATTALYHHHATSFSGTRKGGWPGWALVADALEALGPDVRVMDVGCGNLRFERYLLRKRPDTAWGFVGIDACAPLLDDQMSCAPVLEEARSLELVEADVIDALLRGEGLPGDPGQVDACVCFGFFHHVPGADNRVRLLEQLISRVRPGGVVALSAWRFRRSDELAQKADDLREQALCDLGLSESDLEPGDCLLDWQGVAGAYRYCHHAGDEELDALITAVADEALLVSRYDADGRTGDLNTYLLFKVRG